MSKRSRADTLVIHRLDLRSRLAAAVALAVSVCGCKPRPGWLRKGEATIHRWRGP